LWYLDKKNLSLLGNMVIHLQSPFLQVQTTTAARYHFGYQNKEYIEFGLGTRLAKAVDSTPVNALLFNVGYQLKSLKMGLSYDFPIAGLTDTGTFELTVGYLLDSHQRRGVLCPRF